MPLATPTRPDIKQTGVPELLAPAGDWDSLRAAVANGADAVYFGLDQFNARHRATNFRLDELPELMTYLHARNVKGFLAFNTLIFSDELAEAADYLKQVAEAGVDAVIVQDLGVARLIAAMAPGLAIHGSTQMTLTEPRGIDFVHKLGVGRVVLARELSVGDIAKIAPVATAELEVFVHGALCVAYSGQCLTSESLGGRSANRGQCAQACRLPYQLLVDGKPRDMGDKAYLLSPQDLAAHSLVDDLARLGVSCFKIEGRLKSAHYVAATAQVYRRAIDAYRDGKQFRATEAELGDLQQTFSRGFSHGFLDGVDHQALVQGRFPKSRGRRVGTVVRASPEGVVIRLEERNVLLNPGDGIVFDEGHPEQDEQGGRVMNVDQSGRAEEGLVRITFWRGDLNIAAVPPGSIVWKTDDPAVRKRLEHSFSRDVIAKRIPLAAQVIAHAGKPLTVVVSAEGMEFSAVADQPLAVAIKRPADEEQLRTQFDRLGDTPYELGEFSCDLAGRPMVPASLLNTVRRDAVAGLIAQRVPDEGAARVDVRALERMRGDAAKASVPAAVTTPHLHVLTRTMGQLEAVLAHFASAAEKPLVYADFEDVRQYKQAVALSESAGQQLAVATLRVVKPGEEGFLQQVLDCGPKALLVRSLAGLCFYKEKAPELPMYGDYSMNVSNELTAHLLHQAGCQRLVASYDLSWKQMAAMFGRFPPSLFEVVVHQHMPMFHMEHCVFAHTLSNGKDYRDCGRPCESHKVDLVDRMGQPHPLLPDVGCRNTLFNSQAQSATDYVPSMLELGIRHFRVELLRHKAADVGPLLRQYESVLAGQSQAREVMRSLRVINQLGVTRGTLERE